MSTRCKRRPAASRLLPSPVALGAYWKGALWGGLRPGRPIEPTREVAVYNWGMPRHIIHVSEAEAASNLAALLARVRAGTEVIIEHDAEPVAILHAPQPVRRTIAECIAVLPEDSTSTIDSDFPKDVEAAIDSHRESLDPLAWD